MGPAAIDGAADGAGLGADFAATTHTDLGRLRPSVMAPSRAHLQWFLQRHSPQSSQGFDKTQGEPGGLRRGAKVQTPLTGLQSLPLLREPFLPILARNHPNANA